MLGAVSTSMAPVPAASLLRVPAVESRHVSCKTRSLVVYMGLEVGGCSLFADPSGYVGRIVISNDELSGSVLAPLDLQLGL